MTRGCIGSWRRPCARIAERRRGAAGACLAVALCAVVAGCDDGGKGADLAPAEPTGGPVRVFAVGWKIELDELESFDSFDAAVRARLEADVAPRVAADRPNVVVFPENMGLLAALVGERAAAARQASTTVDAFLALSASYADAMGYYRDRASDPIPIGRAILLAETDTLWRTLTRTFASAARDLGVYIAVTYDVADAEPTADPALVDLFVDESVAVPEQAWAAVGDHVYNQTVVFGPDGEQVFAHRKEYLVPDEESLLDLTHGPVGRLVGDALPFGVAASTISKDAWMPDVLRRIAVGGTRLMLQPEAFSGWAVPEGSDGAWPPDVVKEGGWSAVMRYADLRANVLACMSGNLFDQYFDCQSAILTDPHLGEAGAFIGQDPDVGFARVAPWVVPDGTGTLAERRAALQAVGEALLPGSGSPDENGYVTGTVFMDLDLGAPWPAASDPLAVLPDSGAPGEQRRPAVALLDDGSIAVLFEDTREGPSRAYLARADSAGGPFEPARSPFAGQGGGFRSPALVASGRTLHAVWQTRSTDGGDVWYARSDDGGRSFSAPVALAGAPGDGAAQRDPALAIDGDTGTVHVVWASDASGATRIEHARSSDGGRSFSAPADVEAPPSGGYDPRQNRAQPTVAAAGGSVAVGFASFRTFAWTIEGAVSADDGASFGPVTRWDDADVPFETLASDPDLAARADGGWLLGWTDLRERRANYDVRVRRLPAGGDGSSAPPSADVAVSDARARPQWAPSLAVRGSKVVVVWQDFRDGHDALWMARSSDGGVTFDADARLSSSGGPEQFAPRLAAGGGGAFVVADDCTEGGRRRVCVYAVP